MNEEFVRGFLLFLGPGQFFGSFLLGFLIGFFYKWQHLDGTVITLAGVGVGFTFLTSAYTWLEGNAGGSGASLARAILWLVVCAGMIGGQFIRLNLEVRILQKRRDKRAKK